MPSPSKQQPTKEGSLNKLKQIALASILATAVLSISGCTTARPVVTTQNEGMSEAKELYNKGLSYFLAGEYEKAIPYFEKVIKKNPLYAEAYRNLGVAYGNRRRYQEAVEAFKEAIHLKPDDAKPTIIWGMTYNKLGRYQEAVDAFKEAIHLETG